MRILSLVFIALATTATALIVGSLKRDNHKEKDEFALIFGDVPYAESMEKLISGRS